MGRGRGGRDWDVWERLSFLVAPAAVVDWRQVVLIDVAAETGILDALPAKVPALADAVGLDEHAVRIVLEALALWDVVAVRSGTWSLGQGAPDADEIAVLRHHAGSLRMWTHRLEDRVRRRTPPSEEGRPRRLDLWLQALAVNARASAPATVDACLQARPRARRVLDLGGGHGEYALEFARRGLHTTLQDRPEVIEITQRDGRMGAAGVRLFAGDFFEVLPEELFDVVFCAGIAYTMDGARNQELWRRAKSVVAEDGVLAIHTFLRGRQPLAPIFAVQMLGVNPRADTHGEEDIRDWLCAAGFGPADLVHLDRHPESVFFARP